MLSLTLFLCSMATLALYGRQQTLTCQRGMADQLLCIQQISWFNLFPLDAAQPIPSPQTAETENHCDTDFKTGAYVCSANGVRLITPTGTVSFSSEFFTEITARETVERLNQFFRDPTEQHIVIDSQNAISPILGIVGIVFPLLICGVLLLTVVVARPT